MTESVHGDRRLSPLRVAIATLLVVALAVGAFFGVQSWASAQNTTGGEPWFAAYVDVTATPTFEFETPTDAIGQDVMLSFIVADPNDPCTPSWGGAYTMNEAANDLDLDRRLARLNQAGGGFGVSFGGLLNDELASVCTDVANLAAAYTSVIDRYKTTTIDLDIEGDDLRDTAAGERRAAAIASVQQQRRDVGKPLAVWLTLPVSANGMTEDGTTFVRQMLDAGVDVAGVNAMTMNFGQSRLNDESMADTAIRALKETQRQLDAIYRLADIPLSSGTIWGKLGATPMIGQNDERDEVFTLGDARILNAFAVEQGMGRMSMWSLNRDVTCGPNYPDVTRVSDACSGIDQGDVRFADLLGAGFAGDAMGSSGKTTTSEPVDPNTVIDDPETSPYSIWSEKSAYLAGTKVVWKRNVYEAKWWTRGDLPDNPVLNAWETPWTLIGPVLAGEKPRQLTTLPAGLYPEWAGSAVYEKGARVVFEGVPYEAKWWTQGDSPEAYAADPDSAPWAPLTQEEIEAIVAQTP